MTRPKPIVLTILDGWGHREDTNDNAIASAHTPVWDGLMRDFPYGLINASELHVGLPEGQMGNSEVGHMNIGSGRVLMQDLPKIDVAIASGAIIKNHHLTEFIRKVKEGNGVVHVLGLMSPGGVHSHQNHIAAMANLFETYGLKVFVHAFLDGRDTPPQSALEYMAEFERACKAPVATVSGRYYAMDRDKRWDRVAKAYEVLVHAGHHHAPSVKDAINKSYEAGVFDEFVLPTAISGFQGMADGDGLFMVNFRADRVREMLAALLDPSFNDFERKKTIEFSATLGMSEYSSALAPLIGALFPPEPLTNILGEIVANAGMKQLRIAETEKYAHVTFFFNGGREKEFEGEERILVPSPKVATYDLQPEMSAPEVTDKLVAAIESGRFDLIVVNYANTDMVGHTGNIEAARKAVEAVDSCLGRVVKATLGQGGALVVTADHGNAEMMHDHETEQAHTAHTLNLVPVVLIAERFRGKKIAIPEGKLGDVAPTILQLLGLPQPKEMTGRSLLTMSDE